MSDQNNAPERIWLQEAIGPEHDRTWCAEQQADGDTLYIRADLTRADCAAPQGQVLPKPSPGNETWTVCPDYLVELRDQAGEWAEQTSLEAVEAILLAFVKSSALTPPPAAQTDNTALVADRPIDTSRKEIDTCLFRGSPGWHNRLLRAVADERDVARAEIERLKREFEITHNSRNELAETWKDRAIKAEAERDALMADPLYIIGVNHGWDEAVENGAAHPAARPMQSMLADAERDMRQRAADECRLRRRGGLRPYILALPLKHADREGGASLAQGQKEGE